jgi:phytoene dehydrogenase-like protein
LSAYSLPSMGPTCGGSRSRYGRPMPVVIANGDAVGTLKNLIDPSLLPRRYGQRARALRRGPSAILVNLALDVIPDLPTRVFFHNSELRFGLGNPSIIDSTLAPPGCAAVTLLCLIPEQEAAPWFEMDKRSYRVAKEAFADRLIAATETFVPDLTRRILYRETGAPPTFTRYTSALNGSIYGAARGQWCPAVKSPLPGLMLVGAGCQNGPGVEAAVISGMIAADLIAPRCRCE